jgi:DNA-binding IclR family transcriptional regulator
MDDAPEKDGSVQSVDRAATILAYLAGAGELGVTELARRLGVHKSTASRLVATLEKWELVEQVEGRGKYRLGIGLVRLAGTAVAGLDVVEQARPVCRRLAQETGLTVNLAVLADTQALYLDQVAGTSALQSYNWVGQRIPLHATSNGKVLLSELSPGKVRDLLGDLTAYTSRTIVDFGVLDAELARVRRDGYAMAIDELEDGPGRDRGPDPQRARRDHQLTQPLRADLPPRRRPPRGPARRPRPGGARGVPPARLASARLTRRCPACRRMLDPHGDARHTAVALVDAALHSSQPKGGSWHGDRRRRSEFSRG